MKMTVFIVLCLFQATTGSLGCEWVAPHRNGSLRFISDEESPHPPPREFDCRVPLLHKPLR
jgi:hypothetical protein